MVDYKALYIMLMYGISKVLKKGEKNLPNLTQNRDTNWSEDWHRFSVQTESTEVIIVLLYTEDMKTQRLTNVKISNISGGLHKVPSNDQFPEGEW